MSNKVQLVDDAKVGLRPACAEDNDIMFEWQSNPMTQRYFRNKELPSRAGHDQSPQTMLSNLQAATYISELSNTSAGVLQIKNAIDDEADYEVSIPVAPEEYKKGIGRASLRALRRLMPKTVFCAEVKPENTASHALFQAAGFSIENGRYLYWPIGVS